MPTISPEQLLAELSPAGRELLVRIGRRFASRAVQHQARHTLAALERHAPVLVPFGFGAADAQRLADALAVATALSERAPPAAPAKTTDASYLLALDQAKSARSRARSVLLGSYRRLRLFAPSAEHTAALVSMREVLAATSGPGGDERIYAAELEQLLAVLTLPQVAGAVAPAGGEAARAKLEHGLAQLRAQDGPPQLEPPTADTAQRDAVDGMIVELARTAHFAAKVAASELGERGLAKAFRLRFMS